MCLVGVASIATFGIVSVVGSAAFSDVDLRVGMLYKLFIVNNVLLKLLRTFSLAPNKNRKLFKKDFFQVLLYNYENFLTH